MIAVDMGASHALALRDDGTVVMWGGFANGGIDISAQLTNVAAIAAGYSHNLALLPNASPAADPLTIKTPPATQIVLQLPASDPDGDILQLRVQSLPLAGNLYQYTNGTPTVLVTNSALVTVVATHSRRRCSRPTPMDSSRFAAPRSRCHLAQRLWRVTPSQPPCTGYRGGRLARLACRVQSSANAARAWHDHRKIAALVVGPLALLPGQARSEVLLPAP